MIKCFYFKNIQKTHYSVFGMVFNPPLFVSFMVSYKEKLLAAISEYNRYRVNLVQAELKEHNETGFRVFFDGSFCETCGYYDYYDDLQVQLEDEYGIKSKIVEITHIEKGDLVRFSLLLEDA